MSYLFDSGAAAILGCNLSAYHHHQLITHVLIQASTILIPLYFININKNFECPLKTAITLIDIDIQNKVNSIRNFYLFTDPLLGKEAQNDGLVRSAVVRSKRAITNEKSTYDEMFSFLHLNSSALLLP